jgi:hypothetical protein
MPKVTAILDRLCQSTVHHSIHEEVGNPQQPLGRIFIKYSRGHRRDHQNMKGTYISLPLYPHKIATGPRSIEKKASHDTRDSQCHSGGDTGCPVLGMVDCEPPQGGLFPVKNSHPLR